MTTPIAGLDYSLRQIDLAIVSGSTLVCAKPYDLGVDLASRVAVIQRALDELISQPYAPSVIVMEQPWVREGRGIKSALDLHRIPHYVEALAAERGMSVTYVAVPTWRRNVLGNGKLNTEAAKVLAVQYVRRVYDFSAESHNQADAVCLATYGAQTARHRERVGV